MKPLFPWVEVLGVYMTGTTACTSYIHCHCEEITNFRFLVFSCLGLRSSQNPPGSDGTQLRRHQPWWCPCPGQMNEGGYGCSECRRQFPTRRGLQTHRVTCGRRGATPRAPEEATATSPDAPDEAENELRRQKLCSKRRSILLSSVPWPCSATTCSLRGRTSFAVVGALHPPPPAPAPAETRRERFD
jgi:hypothetical protein